MGPLPDMQKGLVAVPIQRSRAFLKNEEEVCVVQTLVVAPGIATNGARMLLLRCYALQYLSRSAEEAESDQCLVDELVTNLSNVKHRFVRMDFPQKKPGRYKLWPLLPCELQQLAEPCAQRFVVGILE